VLLEAGELGEAKSAGDACEGLEGSIEEGGVENWSDGDEIEGLE
jgi:hypothetical protein